MLWAFKNSTHETSTARGHIAIPTVTSFLQVTALCGNIVFSSTKDCVIPGRLWKSLSSWKYLLKIQPAAVLTFPLRFCVGNVFVTQSLRNAWSAEVTIGLLVLDNNHGTCWNADIFFIFSVKKRKKRSYYPAGDSHLS